MSALLDCRREYKTIIDSLPNYIDDEEVFNTKTQQAEALERKIAKLEKARDLSARSARPAYEAVTPQEPPEADVEPQARTFNLMSSLSSEHAPFSSQMLNGDMHSQFQRCLRKARAGGGFSYDKTRHFATFGEQLRAIAEAAFVRSQGGMPDNRLVRSPSGLGEVDPTGGGFLVQTDFANAIFMLAHEMGAVLSRVNKLALSSNANGIKIPAIDEQSRKDGYRWGGVASYWLGEGDQIGATIPKFREIEFNLQKLGSYCYITNELLEDSSALMSIITQAFSEEIMFRTEQSIIAGDGASKPFGILTSPALVSVAKQNGQTTQTIVKENIDNMWSRLYARNRNNSVWLINQLCLPQLFQLNQAVGTGGQLVYLPPGGLSAAPFGTLYGRPVIETEYNPYLGTTGDIMLVDLSQYMLVDKGGVNAATSMHVAFLTDQMAFRITYRLDGKPLWAKPLIAAQGGANNLTLSPFIALASR